MDMKYRIVGICPTCNNDLFREFENKDNEVTYECLKCEDNISIDNMNYISIDNDLLTIEINGVRWDR